MTTFKRICISILPILWRAALAAAVFAAVALIGVCMVLSAVFNGPSITARNQLTATLLEYEKTQSIPGYFLDPATIDGICAVTDSLPAAVSDPTRIQFGAASSDGTTAETIETDRYTAELHLLHDPAQAPAFTEEGSCFAGFTDDGVLIVATDKEEAEALGITGRCERILIMDGQVNTGLYAAASGLTTRCAIGQRADGTLLAVTIHGGHRKTPGGSWQDLIDILTQYGAVNACSVTISEE